MNSYERFCELMKEKGVKASDIARDTGISTSTLTDWKMGRTNPKADKMKMLSMYFNVDLDYLMGNTTIRKKIPTLKGLEAVPANGTEAALMSIAAALKVNPLDSLPEREKRLLRSYSMLSEEMQQNFLNLIESLAKNPQQQP